MRWTIAQVAGALGTRPGAGLDALARVAGVSIDSRTIRAGELFVAIHGPRHDGHNFVMAALDAGALAAVVAQDRVSEFAEPVRSKLFAVEDPIAALQNLAAYPKLVGGIDPISGELATLHDVAAEQVVVGNGAAQLLAATAHALMEPGDELVTPWPSYPLYPVMARRARGRAVPVPGFAAEAIVRALNQRTRIVALCNPNDPTGELLSTAELDELLGMLPERVVVLLDEALAHYAERPLDETLPLLERHPRLLVFRTFSKAWGLAGLRCGYAIGAPDAGPLLERLEPELGLNELAQAGVLEALRATRPALNRRTAAVRAERSRLVSELRSVSSVSGLRST